MSIHDDGGGVAVCSDSTAWKVALQPGACELEVTVAFETADGRSGDLSGTLGLVDPEREPASCPLR